MAKPLAYFLTWTTYGVWLPGDARGWVCHGQSGKDVPYKAPAPNMTQTAQRLMKQLPVRLNRDYRRIVE